MSSENTPKISQPIPLSRYALYVVLAVGGLAADLYTKSLVFGKLGMPGEYVSTVESQSKMKSVWWFVDNVFGVQTSLNEGALFGMGQGQIPLFLVMSVLALAFIVVWLIWFKGIQSILLTVISAMFTAGILGNLYDRIGLHRLTWNYANDLHEVGEPVYAVRDWILVMIGDWPWPNFNIADSLMVSGVILLFIAMVFYPKLFENNNPGADNSQSPQQSVDSDNKA